MSDMCSARLKLGLHPCIARYLSDLANEVSLVLSNPKAEPMTGSGMRSLDHRSVSSKRRTPKNQACGTDITQFRTSELHAGARPLDRHKRHQPALPGRVRPRELARSRGTSQESHSAEGAGSYRTVKRRDRACQATAKSKVGSGRAVKR